MSAMLQQAIIDAKALRESAMSNAETQILEKYSVEVKEAMKNLLEQGEEMTAEEAPEEDNTTTMEQVPMAHVAEEQEEVVVVDLDDLVAAAEEEPDAPEAELDRAEIADEIGIELEDPANRSDEVTIDEDALIDLFKEMMVVDVDPANQSAAERYAAKEDDEEEQEEYYVATVRDDGMTEEDMEEARRETARLEMMESIKTQNKKLRKLLEKAKTRLEEVNVSNARLLYANKVLQNSSLNEQQKNKIANLLSEATSADEAETIYNTLHKAMQATPSQARPQSLSEAVTKRSSVILSSRPRQESKEKTTEISRWATLAGLTQK